MSDIRIDIQNFPHQFFLNGQVAGKAHRCYAVGLYWAFEKYLAGLTFRQLERTEIDSRFIFESKTQEFGCC
jgi:hypothetical protein